MSNTKKQLAKLEKIQVRIAGVLGRIDQLESERIELYEAADTLEIELSELQQKKEKIQAKLAAKNTG